MPKMSTTTQTTKEVAHEALDELIAYARSKHGLIAQILSRFNAKITTPVPRSQFERWLITDRARRAEPMLGAGLVLLSVLDDLKRTQQFRDWKGEQ